MDTVILAGGYGTRLKGVWDAPKCLAPINGKPIIGHLLEQVAHLSPRCVVLALGNKAQEVLTWYWSQPSFFTSGETRVEVVIEATPLGTAEALRRAYPTLCETTLVLNGDTLPDYDLRTLAYNYKGDDIFAAFCKGTYSGASVLSVAALDYIYGTSKKDLDDYILNPVSCLSHTKIEVRGFFDVGTIENFYKAQQMKGTE